MQALERRKRRATWHGREQLAAYLAAQSALEETWLGQVSSAQHNEIDHGLSATELSKRADSHPTRTVYIDGVFDLFHVGHLEGLQKVSLVAVLCFFAPWSLQHLHCYV